MAFYYGDTVRVIDGFYKGVVGNVGSRFILTEKSLFSRDKTSINYLVYFKSLVRKDLECEVFNEEDLKLYKVNDTNL